MEAHEIAERVLYLYKRAEESIDRAHVHGMTEQLMEANALVTEVGRYTPEAKWILAKATAENAGVYDNMKAPAAVIKASLEGSVVDEQKLVDQLDRLASILDKRIRSLITLISFEKRTQETHT